MTSIKAVVAHDSFINCGSGVIQSSFGSISLRIICEEGSTKIGIGGLKDPRSASEFLDHILSLIFLCFGSFPKIVELSIDGNKEDRSKLVKKYSSHLEFIKPTWSLCGIGESVFSKPVLEKYLDLNLYPIYSIQYLVSDAYRGVVTDHRITLILHALEGIVQDRRISDVKQEMKVKFNLKKTRDFEGHVYLLCRDYLNPLQDKYELNFYQLLHLDEYCFIQCLADTRDWYSHMLKTEVQPNRLKEGTEQTVHFLLLYFLLRLYLFDWLGISADENKEKECFKGIYNLAVIEKMKELFRRRRNAPD